MAFLDHIEALKEQIESFDPSEIQPDNIGSWPTFIKVIVWLVVFIAIMGLGYKFIVLDTLVSTKQAEAQELQLKLEYEKKSHEATNLDAYRKQMVEMTESFEALVSRLPSDTEVPGLLEDISSKGASSGLMFSSIQLQSEKESEFYIELPIKIKATGTYHDMGVFVSGVAGLPRIVTLSDFTITPSSKKERDNSKLNITILASTYRYKESPKKRGRKKGRNK